LVGQRHRERRAGEQARGDEDGAESLARPSLLGQGSRELLLGEETFQNQNLAEERPVFVRSHTEHIGSMRHRLKQPNICEPRLRGLQGAQVRSNFANAPSRLTAILAPTERRLRR
jgi:hypothetical protein